MDHSATEASVSLLAALDAVGRTASARSAEIEAGRRLPPDLVAALVATGVFRTWVPARYGGRECDLRTGLDAIELASYHDGSTGWCVMIGVSSSLLAGRLSPDWAEQVFGDPGAILGGYAMPAGTARPVAGGLRVSGRWSWGSGTSHCTWIGGGARLVDAAGAPAPRADGLRAPFVLFDRADVEVLDTWHVAGLKGTASNDYVVRDAFVPEGRWGEFLGAAAVCDGPLYRFSFTGALALGTAAVGLGLARRAVDELVAIGGKIPSGSGRSLAERPTVQAEIATAEATLRSARAFLHEVVDDAWEASRRGERPAVEQRRLLRLAATHAMAQAARAVDLCYTAGGGSSIWETSPLQRCFRDVHVATQHGMVAPRTLEPLGRLAFGLDTDTSQL